MENRILKESIKTSDEIDQLSLFEYACFTRLIVTVDDYGRYYARPIILRNSLFPLRGDVSTEAIVEAFRHLEELDLIRVYTVKGKEYLQLTTWGKHQTVTNKKSKFPGPEEQDVSSGESNGFPLKAIECQESRNPIQSGSECEAEAESERKSASRGREGDGGEEKGHGDDEKENGERGENDRDLEAVWGAWKTAKYPTDAVTRRKVGELLGKYGKGEVVEAIEKAVEANARSPLLYVSAVLDPEHRARRPVNWNPAANYHQREYKDDTTDMDRMMVEEMRVG